MSPPMRPIVLAATLLAALAAPAAAQTLTGVGVEGNWGCRANIDGTKAGLLTIFAGSYGYASANFGSQASGTGLAELASNGVTFKDGNIVTNAGIATGILSFDTAGKDILVLYTAEKPVLTCYLR